MFLGENPTMKIQKGMTTEEVHNLMGKPNFRRFNDMGEEWEYNKYNTKHNKIAVIIFFDNNKKVVAMDSFPLKSTTTTNNSVVLLHHDSRNQNVSDVTVQNIYDTVEREIFNEDKIKVLKASIQNKLFTAEQATKLLSLMTFSDDKMRLLKILAPHIIDTENYKLILDELSILNRDEATDILLNRKTHL